MHTLGADQYLYLLEEYLPGGTLRDVLAACGTVSRETVLDLGEALIGAITQTERLRLVHRDLKPENIMLRADGKTPVIVDFGLVRNLAETSLTQTWAMTGPGTPLYSTTEQLTNDKVGIDWRADQFALGIVLSMAGLGMHPYQAPGEDPAAAVQRVAARGSQVPDFFQQARAKNLPVLIKMTNAWPIHRYRKPDLLLAAWVGQRGIF
jgi:serine/threonine-protein kinase